MDLKVTSMVTIALLHGGQPPPFVLGAPVNIEVEGTPVSIPWDWTTSCVLLCGGVMPLNLLALLLEGAESSTFHPDLTGSSLGHLCWLNPLVWNLLLVWDLLLC